MINLATENVQKGNQGDVQFRTIDGLPHGAVAIEDRPIALGEHSGHQHILTGDVQLYAVGETTYAAIGHDGATLQHVHERQFSAKGGGDWRTRETLPMADHKPISLKPNQVVELWIQTNFNPFTRLMELSQD